MTEKVLLFFDMDETIVACDTIFAFFEKYGKKEKAEELYEWSKNNPEKIAELYDVPIEMVYPGMDVELICKEILSETKGVSMKVFEELAGELPIYPGVIDFFKSFKSKYGDNIFIVSSSFEPLARAVAKRVGVPVKNVRATKLKECGGKIVGFIGPVMEAKYKEDSVRKIAKENGVPFGNCVGVGDGKFDYYFIRAITKEGGLGIAVSENDFLLKKAKPQIVMPKPNYKIIAKAIGDFVEENKKMGIL